MRLISYNTGNDVGVGVMVNDTTFVSLSNAAPDLPRSMRQLLGDRDAMEAAKRATERLAATHALADVTVLPPVPDPSAIWCAALNYSEHQAEVGRKTSEYPEVFLRPRSSFVGHGQPLSAPYAQNVTRFDFEGELVAVIGKGGRYISKEDALSHLAGYTIGNEGSVRDFQRHNRQYGIGKSFDASGSYGPWIATADAFADPYAQTLTTRSGGVDKQKCRIGLMLHSIETLISYISQGYAFQPGDILFTGTPASLPGTTKKMEPGDVVEIEVSGLGTLCNPVIQQPAN